MDSVFMKNQKDIKSQQLLLERSQFTYTYNLIGDSKGTSNPR